jgi:predicted TIM-barrel fold metal-dependent hydrolase
MNKPYVFAGNAYRHREEVHQWASLREEAPLEPELPIVDPHHHCWDDAHRGRYLVHELAADVATGHNIVATVFIECGSQYRAGGPEAMKPVGEVEFVNGIAAMSASGGSGKAKLCAGIVGHADMRLGDDAQPVLEALIAAGNGRLRGIRHGVTWDTGNAARFGRHQVPQHQVLDPKFQKGVARLAKAGLTFESWQFHPQLPDVAQLVRGAPGTTMILNHCGGLLGLPPHEDRKATFEVWRKNVRDLAQFPNLVMKVGGLGMLYCDWDFHLRDVPPSSEELAQVWRPYVEECIAAFGPNRCMMESNFPVDKQSCGYGVLWNALKRITQNYSAPEKAALYRDTAARVYRLEI